MKRYYIGLAATLHDPALAIVDPSGEPVFAEATERYLQSKRAYNCTPDDMIRIPELIREYCDRDAELVAATTWSAVHLARLTMVSLAPGVPGGQVMKELDDFSWPLPDPRALFVALRNSISQASLNLASSKQIPNTVRTRHYDHHLTHAAHAAYTSPFDESAVAVVDAYGEMSATSFFHYHGGVVEPLPPVPGTGPHIHPSASLGAFYGRLCALCGFDPIKGDEWKVMGLASYGKHDVRLYDLLRPMIRVDGLTLVQGCSNADLLRRLRTLRSMMRPTDSSPLETANLAHTGQVVFEEIMTELLNNLYDRGLPDNLALSGGCALNSSYNGRLLERTRFKCLHVPPAPGDDGSALGAALLAFYDDHPTVTPSRRFHTPYLGSSMSSATLDRLRQFGGFHKLRHAPEDMPRRAAELIAGGKIIGWVQDRAEFGPRALGNRSILADPRPRDMKDRINTQVKFREEFRPFAPSILDEHGPEYFENYQASPYMERTLRFRPEVCSRVPAVVHVDMTGRLQSVRREWNPRYHALLEAFHELTGIPILLNTSLNVMGRPIAHSVEDVLGMFYTSGLDALVIEDYLIQK